MSYRSYSWLLGALLMTAPAVDAAEPIAKVGTVEGLTEYRLPNGLRVLLLPDASKPQVTVNCTIFVGSRHEGYGETGMAHLLEHMVFKGTPTFPDVPKALRDHGAEFNGTTWTDRTNYYETMPATDENLEFGIRLEADRLVNSFVRREDLVSEMTVVRNEFESGENNPERVLGQRVMAAAFEWHNYGKSTIGNRSDIERVPIENLQAFYRKFYQADNAMLIVAGKFDEKKALEYVVKYFGPLKKPTRQLPKTYTEEPPQDGERSVTLRRVGTVGAVAMAYHVPAGSHEDFAAVEVLEDCLTAQPAGRLYKAMVETKKATQIQGQVFAWHDPSLLSMMVKVEDANGIDAARDALIAATESLAEKPFTAEEVERVKQRYRKYNDQLLADSKSFAIDLSNWAGVGDWRLFFVHRDRVEKVTADDVNRVAAKYLTRNNRTVGLYYPAAKAERVTVPETPDVAKLVADYKGREGLASGEAFDPTPANIEKRAVRGQMGNIKTAFLAKKTRGETVNVRLTLRFGNEQALTGQTTVLSILGDAQRSTGLLARGTASKTRQQYQDALDKLGARVQYSVAAGVLVATVEVKRANLAATLQLVGEVLRTPALSEKEFELIKKERLETLKNQKTDPQALAMRALQRKLTPYPPENIRYVPTIDESIERLQAVTLERVKALYASHLSAQAGELSAVGDFDPAVVTNVLSKALADWKSAIPYSRIGRPAPTVEKGETVVIETPDKANAVFVAGQLYGMTDADPDYAAMEVGNYLLGGAPLASRLSNRVRGEKGLSYGVGSVFSAEAIDKSASFMVYAITNPKNREKLNATIGEEVQKFLKDGVSLEELEAGKKAYLDQLKLEVAEDSSLAVKLANYLFLGRNATYDQELEKRVESLTPTDVQKAFQKRVDPKRFIIVEAGDFKKQQ